jgi:lipopolysaccharide exporter
MIDSSKVMIGTILSQAVAVLSIPLLSRLYTTESIGENSIFVAVMAVTTTIACGRYEFAIMLPTEEEDAMAVLCTAVLFCVAFSLLCLPIGETLLSLKILGISRQMLLAATVGILTAGLSNALSFWLLRKKSFWLVSCSKMIGSIVTTLVQIVPATFGYNSSSTLLVGILLGHIALLMTYGFFFFRNYFQLFLKSFSFIRITNVIRRYSKFPLIDFWSATIDNVAGQIPIFILRQFFTVSQVGSYAMTIRILSIPVGLVSASISQVFFQRASEMKRHGKSITELTNKLYRKLVYIGMPPLIALSISGEWVFTNFLGDQWSEAGKLAQIMCSAMFFALLFNPLSSIVIVCERQELALITRILMLISAIFPLSASIYFYPQQIITAVFSLSISQSILYLLLSQWNLRIASNWQYR